VDLGLVGLYLLLLLLLAYRRGRRESEATREFLLAGRTLTLPAFVATLVSTWYGGVLGVGEYSYLHGLSNWLALGGPYYAAGLLFAFLLARRARQSALVTVPQRLLVDHGPAVGTVGATLVFINSLPAAYVVMLAALGRRVLGLSAEGFAAHAAGVALAVAFSLLFVVGSGFRAVVRTNALQFVLMFGGFLLLLPVAFRAAGGLGALDSLPPEHLSWDGGLGLQAILVWYVIALQTLVEPTFYQRCFAARSPAVARRGILWAVGFWVLFDALTTLTGMYARVLLPDLADPVEAYPALADLILPWGLRGLFYVGLIATVMSTVESFLFVAATTLGFDIPHAWRAWRRGGRVDPEGIENGEGRHRRATRWGLLLAGLATVALALTSSSVIALWKAVGSVITPALLLPLLGGFFPRLRAGSRTTLASMLVSAGVALAWMVPGWRGEANPLGLEPIFPALLVSLLFHLPGLWRARPGASENPS
jgi:SSS family solute:Na+ symporter